MTAGAAAQLAVTAPPGTGSIATPFATQPIVNVEDAGGNTVTTGYASGHVGGTPAAAPSPCTTKTVPPSGP